VGFEPTKYGGFVNRCPKSVTNGNTQGYANSPKHLGALLGALAAEICPSCPDLAAVVTAWPHLPEALKAGIVAMVKAAVPAKAAGPHE